MKKGYLGLTVSCIIALFLLASSCAPATTPAPIPSTTPTPSQPTTSAPAPTSVPVSTIQKPKYGGTINITGSGAFIPRWDPSGPNSTPVTAVYEGLMQPDWYQYSEANPYTYPSHETKIMVGWLAESWEQTDPQTIAVHLRKGIKFQNKPPVNGREVVAADVKYSFDMFLNNPLSAKGMTIDVDKITAPDKYTVVFHSSVPHTLDFIFDAVHPNSSNCLVFPHEVTDVSGKTGFDNWQNCVGTGPFMVKDYIAGSSITFIRNPDYWQTDQAYPENRLPYADGLRINVISDVATAVAALRTGKVDMYAPTWDQIDSLKKVNPWLKYKIYPAAGITQLAMNYKNKPFTDVRVRQALNMAIDGDAIIKDIYGGYGTKPLQIWPYFPSWSSCYVKPEEYPQIVQDMFSHNIVKAKQLLADAGFPSGFKTEITVPNTPATAADYAALFKQYFSDIGVDVTIKVMDASVYSTAVYKVDYPGLTSTGLGVGNSRGFSPTMTFAMYFVPTSTQNKSGYNSPDFLAAFAKAQVEQNEAKRNQMYKDLAIKVMTDAPYIIPPPASRVYFWGPWLNNYWGGETINWNAGDLNTFKHYWIDQDLKQATVGGK